MRFVTKALQIDALFAASDLIAINAMGVLNARGFESSRRHCSRWL
jgi:DNA-binding LacI/PurR family transcriptional regulator